MQNQQMQLGILFTLIFILASYSFSLDRPRIVGSKIPTFCGKTINGNRIDTSYFKNKVTLITFFHVGCQPCLFEINWLKKLKKQPGFQVLYIVPQTTKEMLLFNSSEPNYYSRIRLKNKAGSIDFDILSECEANKAKSQDSPCNSISEQMRVTGYPTTLLVTGERVIRQVWYGFALDSVNAVKNISDWQIEIDLLLFSKNKPRHDERRKRVSRL